MAWIVASQKKPNAITCYIEGLSTTYSYNDRNIDWYYSNLYKGTSYLDAHVSWGGSFEATGLTPNTKYNITAKIFYTSPSGRTYVTLYGVATTAPLDIAPWSWSSSVQNALDNKLEFNISASEWLSFYNKINEIRNYKGLSNYSFTISSTYIASGKDFYAWIFLQAANAIDDLNTGVATECLNVSSGDDIYAWYFTNLKTALNNALL